MKCITLREFCNKQGFYPYNHDSSKTLSVLAKIIGVSNSDISKLYNGKTFEYGDRWDKIEAFIASYGYQLVSSNSIDSINGNIIKENKKLKEHIESLENYIKLMELQLDEVKELIRVSKRIAEYDNDRRTIVCKK